MIYYFPVVIVFESRVESGSGFKRHNTVVQ